MKATKASTGLAVVLLVAGLGPFAAADDEPTAPETNRYIVAFHELPDLSAGDVFGGAAVLEVLPGLNMIFVLVANYPVFLAQTQLDSNVRYIEWDNPQYSVLNFAPNDTRYNDAGHWGSKKIGAQTAWDATLGTTAVKVAHIDSGLNKAHEEFSGQARVLQGWDYVSNDNNPQDTSGCSYHGTHTTGTAGATINNAKGIAGLSQHQILPIRAFSGPISILCTASTTNLVKAVKFAADQGAHLSSNSWGGGTSSALNDAIQYAHNKGTIHVAAAGNSGPCTNCVSEPWKTKASIVIVVASTTSSDAQSSFSSEGPQVDVAAPGSSILSSASGTSGYSTLSGTSMATPHVTGTAALIKALNPSFTLADIENRLKSTAVDLGAGGRDDDFGNGRINAAAAVN